MSHFNCTIARTPIQNKIIDLEEKYMNKLEDIFTSKDFIVDLKKIEFETQYYYSFLADVWGKKNKIKEASERLVRHHVYKNFDGLFYSSPISCDIALELDDIILEIDIKTIDKIGNSGELESTQFEHNQTSFINNPVDSAPPFPGFKVKSNLQSVDPLTKKPILTYLIKIGYADNNNGLFNLINDSKHPSLVLTCLPNGQLSNLFDFDLFLNFKDYNYYSKVDGVYFIPRRIAYDTEFTPLNELGRFTLIESRTDIPDEWSRVIGKTKVGYFDNNKKILWYVVSRKNGSNREIYLEAVKFGNTARFNDQWLKERYNSSNSSWSGERKYYCIYKKKDC